MKKPQLKVIVEGLPSSIRNSFLARPLRKASRSFFFSRAAFRLVFSCSSLVTEANFSSASLILSASSRYFFPLGLPHLTCKLQQDQILKQMKGKSSRRGLTKHTFGLLICLRQILLNQLQIQLELNVLVFQFSVASRKITGFLRRTNRQMSKTIHFRVAKEKS